MEIIIGKTAGFCFGVKRAVNGSLNEIENDKEVYCLGELVHNRDVIKELEDKGIKIIDDINEIKTSNARIIIRAHGIKKELYDEIRRKKLELIDYTCPFVLKIHDIVEKYYKDGYFVFVVGNKDHPEIIGTVSYCEKNSFVIENENDLEEAFDKLEKSQIKKLLVIVQTTYSEEKFLKLIETIKKRLSKSILLDVKNTICNATYERQKEVAIIAKKVDVMIIIGGKNSSNTKKLYDIAIENGKETFLVENKNDLPLLKMDNVQKIGIMAGASTPNSSIMDVVDELKRRY